MNDQPQDPASSDGTISLELQRRIDNLCDEFREGLRTGNQPRIEDALGKLPTEARGIALRELIREEVEFRVVAGEQVDVEEYLTRFPDHESMVKAAL